MEEIMVKMLTDLVAQFPWLVSVLLAMGVFRMIFKPLMALADAYVLATPNKKDDEEFAKFKVSKFYSSLVWALDFLASVKLDKFMKKEEPKP